VSVITDYGERRIDVTPIAACEGRWNAAVSIRHMLSEEKPYRRSRAKMSAELADAPERSGPGAGLI
jgi:hypothetical protein